MSSALLKKAQHALQNKVLTDQNKKRAENLAKSEQINKLGTLGGGALAAIYDHKKGSADGAEPAKLFTDKEGNGGYNANLVVGVGATVACLVFKKIPARGFVGSVAAGMGAAGLYRQMMEGFEKH